MANAGFFEQKSASPTRFAFVAAGHAAVLAAVLLAAGPVFEPQRKQRTQVEWVDLPQPPDPNPPQRQDPQRPVQRPIFTPPQQVELPPRTPIGVETTGDPLPPQTGETTTVTLPPRDPPADPIRVGPQLDPRYASALQPQYPGAEQRAGRNGTVVIEVTIGTDGRVRAARRVSATSDLFWAAAERQALTRWRFRPATVDGRPVESSRTMTIHFRIEDV